MKLTDSNGRSATFSGSACYSFCTALLGLDSISFEIEENGDNVTFVGSGWGHNLGLSQDVYKRQVPTLVIICCDAFPERTASASSIIVFGVSLASLVSPVLMGRIMKDSPQAAMLSITACTVIAALSLPRSKIKKLPRSL